MAQKRFLQRNIFIPSDHGSWVFLFSPLLIGFFTAGRWTFAGWYLILGALVAFLIRQPTVMAVKALSGRRTRKDLSVAVVWFALYALVGLVAVVQLVRLGYVYLFWLAIPGVLVFIWHLWLVSKRAERHRMGVDILAAGSLCVAAPAAYWVSVGYPAAVGWWLWGLVWFQTAASIVYAFLRLTQRGLKNEPSRREKWQLGQRAFVYGTFNLAAAAVFALLGWLPVLVWLPFLLQWLEIVWGIFNPALGVKPTRIGIRQLVVSTLFTLIFILVW